jgi:hypothetical protein
LNHLYPKNKLINFISYEKTTYFNLGIINK